MKSVPLLTGLYMLWAAAANCQSSPHWCGSGTGDEPEFARVENLLARNNRLQFKMVVHIIYYNSAQNISDAQVFAQIQILNQIFSKANYVMPAVPFEFKSFIGVPDFNFCLADRDPDNKPTSGIRRVKTNKTNIGCLSLENRRSVFYSSDGGADVWDPARYINVYVVDLEPCGFLGKAIFPWEATASEDGIIIDYRLVGDIGSVASMPGFSKGKTLVHELGHYFGLYHLSGDRRQCTGDDLVDDTPPQNGEYFGCPAYPQFSCGASSMFQNFMSLTNDECLLFFTAGQVNRMREMIAKYRPELMTSCAKPKDTHARHRLFQLHEGWLISKEDHSSWSGSVELYDSMGRRIWWHNKKEVTYVSVPVHEVKLPSGVYLLRVSENHVTETFKIFHP